MEKWGKIILALLLLSCLFDMPYGYYQLVRFLSLVGFSALAYKAKSSNKEIETAVFISLAILFQPIFKISLGRELWNIVDVIVGVGLLISVLKEYLKK